MLGSCCNNFTGPVKGTVNFNTDVFFLSRTGSFQYCKVKIIVLSFSAEVTVFQCVIGNLSYCVLLRSLKNQL